MADSLLRGFLHHHVYVVRLTDGATIFSYCWAKANNSRNQKELIMTRSRTKVRKQDSSKVAAPPRNQWLEQSSEQLDEVRESLGELQKEIGGLSDYLHNEWRGLVDPGHEFWDRYRHDCYEEKREIARRVCEVFMNNHRRSFMQASSQTLHLAAEIVRTEIAACLIHTNSAVLPLAILPQKPAHRVYTLCGCSYDAPCGGWLAVDPQAEGYLRGLFSRREDPLTTAFLAPIAVTPGQGLLYERAEAARMAVWAIEAAKEVVVLVPARRLHGQAESLSHHTWIEARFEGWQQMTLVTMGRPSGGGLESLVEEYLRPQDRIRWQVHWRETMNTQWQISNGH